MITNNSALEFYQDWTSNGGLLQQAAQITNANDKFAQFQRWLEQEEALRRSQNEERIALRWFIVAPNDGDGKHYALYRWTEAGMPERIAGELTLGEAQSLRLAKVAAEILAGIKIKAPQEEYVLPNQYGPTPWSGAGAVPATPARSQIVYTTTTVPFWSLSNNNE